MPPPSRQALPEHTLLTLDDPAQELTSSLWALATLNAKLDTDVLAALAAAVQASLGQCSLQNVANAAWALALLGALPSGLWEAIVLHFEGCLHRLSGPGEQP